MPVHIHHQYNHQRRRRRRKAEDNDKDDPTKTNNQDETNVGSKTSLLDKYSSLRFILIVLVLATTHTVTKASAQQKAYHQPAIDNTIYDELVQLSRNRTLNIYSPPSKSSSSSSSSSNSEYDYSQILQYSADNNGYNYNYVSSGNNGDLIYYPSGDMVGNNNNKSTRNANSGGVCVGDVCTDGIFKWHRSKVKNIYVGGIFPMVYNYYYKKTVMLIRIYGFRK